MGSSVCTSFALAILGQLHTSSSPGAMFASMAITHGRPDALAKAAASSISFKFCGDAPSESRKYREMIMQPSQAVVVAAHALCGSSKRSVSSILSRP